MDPFISADDLSDYMGDDAAVVGGRLYFNGSAPYLSAEPFVFP